MVPIGTLKGSGTRSFRVLGSGWSTPSPIPMRHPRSVRFQIDAGVSGLPAILWSARTPMEAIPAGVPGRSAQDPVFRVAQAQRNTRGPVAVEGLTEPPGVPWSTVGSPPGIVVHGVCAFIHRRLDRLIGETKWSNWHSAKGGHWTIAKPSLSSVLSSTAVVVDPATGTFEARLSLGLPANGRRPRGDVFLQSLRLGLARVIAPGFLWGPVHTRAPGRPPAVVGLAPGAARTPGDLSCSRVVVGLWPTGQCCLGKRATPRPP